MNEEIQNRLPCLLDRLIDEAPLVKIDPQQRRGISLQEYRAAVLRDLRWLLNSPQHLSREGIRDYPEVARSVLNYGTRNIAGLVTGGLNETELENGIRDSILDFEPRIVPESLSVKVVRESMDQGKLAFEINGHLWALPHAERISFRTEIDLETGTCELLTST